MGEKKRKRRKNSKTENVSNQKSNMAEKCSPENQTISEVIGNANEFLYGMNMSQLQNVSTPLNPHIHSWHSTKNICWTWCRRPTYATHPT